MDFGDAQKRSLKGRKGKTMSTNWVLEVTQGKTSSSRALAALAVVREQGIPVREKHRAGIIAQIISFDTSSCEAALSLAKELKDLKSCSFRINGKVRHAREVIGALGCYISRDCPVVYDKAICDVDAKGLFSTFGCTLTATLDETKHAWWTFGSLKETAPNTWIWAFNKKKIQSILSASVRIASCCPIFPAEEVEQRKNAIPEAIAISSERGMVDYFDSLGIPRDYLRYPTETSSGYVNHCEDLIEVSKHSGSCPLCSKWQGKIFSASGTSSTYPPIWLALQGGLFHPGCRHGEACYIPSEGK